MAGCVGGASMLAQVCPAGDLAGAPLAARCRLSHLLPARTSPPHRAQKETCELLDKIHRWKQHRSSKRYWRHMCGGGEPLPKSDCNGGGVVAARKFDLPSKVRSWFSREALCCAALQRAAAVAKAVMLTDQPAACTKAAVPPATACLLCLLLPSRCARWRGRCCMCWCCLP